ncbi:MAG TPA: hypothetical protein VE422_30890 [Terriglobia bacterium]|nr:hypothetical protein [Terriglobia bacterium]
MDNQIFNEELKETFTQLKSERLSDDRHPNSEVLLAFLEKELDPETTRHVRMHTFFCQACKSDLYGLKAAIAEDQRLIKQASPTVIEAVLRVARGMVECLRISENSNWQNLPVAAVARGPETVYLAPFQVTETLTDPDGSTSGVDLEIEESSRPDRVRLVARVEPARKDWKILLRDSDRSLLASLSLSDPQIEVSSGISYGFYAVEIRKGEESLATFNFTVEPFSLPEAIDAGLEYLGAGEYTRALVILESAVERYQDSQEAWDVLCLARAIALQDRETFEREQQQLGVTRSAVDLEQQLRKTVAERKVGLEENVAYWLTTSMTNQSVLTDALVSRLKEERPSLSVIQALDILQERIVATDKKVDLLIKVNEEQRQALNKLLETFTTRTDYVFTLFIGLQKSIDEIRKDTAQDIDDKFANIGQMIDRLSQDLSARGVSLPDYAPHLRQTMGAECWEWLGSSVRNMFVWGEAVYWFLARQETLSAPDFSPALAEVCRAYELLLNIQIGSQCARIRDTIRANWRLKEIVKTQTDLDPDKALKPDKSISMVQAALLLRLAKTIRKLEPESFPTEVDELAASSPALFEPSFLEPMSFIGITLRNGKFHPAPDSPFNFTTLDEMLLLRKLVFGFDEESTEGRLFFDRLEKAFWLSPDERRRARDEFKAQWRTYPGLVSILWRR